MAFGSNKTETKQEKGKAPIHKEKVGGIEVAVWENESDKGIKFYTASMSRSYKDSKGEWQKSDSYRVNDLPKLIVALQRSYEKIVVKDEDEN